LRIDSGGVVLRRGAGREDQKKHNRGCRHPERAQKTETHADYFITVMGKDTSTVFGGRHRRSVQAW
jgi:hypothetical protein